jgi:16S rRNA (cytosine967-C5)-methyltransferase
MPPPDRVRDIVLEVWQQVSASEAFLSDALGAAFRRHKDLGPRGREGVVETLHFMLHNARRIEYALSSVGKLRRDDPDADLARYLAARVLMGKLKPGEAERPLKGLNWDIVADVDSRIRSNPDPARRFALAHSLPDFLAERLHAEYGAEADALAASLGTPAPFTLRVNTIKAKREEILEALREQKISAHPTPLSPTGIVLEQHINVAKLQAFKSGAVEVQDEASQLIALLVAPPPRGLIVDACAGAGGKALALGALMNNHGRLVALDPSARRLEELRRRARRAGLANTQALKTQATQAGDQPTVLTPEVQAFLGKADRVLVDVPCSGTGAIRRKPEIRWRLSVEELERLPQQQFEITRHAMALCAPGGRVIYATCSILADENERVVERLLQEPGFTLVPAKEILGKALMDKTCDPSGTFLKLLPHRQHTDGFFAAVLRRKK